MNRENPGRTLRLGQMSVLFLQYLGCLNEDSDICNVLYDVTVFFFTLNATKRGTYDWFDKHSFRGTGCCCYCHVKHSLVNTVRYNIVAEVPKIDVLLYSFLSSVFRFIAFFVAGWQRSDLTERPHSHLRGSMTS